eukprot:Gb_37180 [translate_table: standard]
MENETLNQLHGVACSKLEGSCKMRGITIGNEVLEMEIVSTDVQLEQQRQTCFQDLPENCISVILSFTTPKDVCSLAPVSPIFRAAANSDCVWEAMLPPRYLKILSAAVSPLVFSSKKELYFLLCDSIRIDNGTKRLWLERPTGKICYMLSARDLRIVWGDDERYWLWVPRDESSLGSVRLGKTRFGQVARLKAVCWLEVGGRFDSTLLSPNTDYCVSFVLKFGHHQYGWDNAPIKFSVTPPGQDTLKSSPILVDMDDASEDEEDEDERTPVIQRNDGWREYVAGEFRVEEIGDGLTTHIEFTRLVFKKPKGFGLPTRPECFASPCRRFELCKVPGVSATLNVLTG